MNVSDIMTKEVITVQKNTAIEKAAELLTKLRIHGMPVINADNKVIGIITESDFFTKDSSSTHLPTFLNFNFMNKEPDDMNEKLNQIGLGEKQTIRVADIMTENCQTVKFDLPVQDLVILIKESNFNTFPVIDDSGTLSGIVTVADVIKLL